MHVNTSNTSVSVGGKNFCRETSISTPDLSCSWVCYHSMRTVSLQEQVMSRWCCREQTTPTRSLSHIGNWQSCCLYLSRLLYLVFEAEDPRSTELCEMEQLSATVVSIMRERERGCRGRGGEGERGETGTGRYLYLVYTWSQYHSSTRLPVPLSHTCSHRHSSVGSWYHRSRSLLSSIATAIKVVRSCSHVEDKTEL